MSAFRACRGHRLRSHRAVRSRRFLIWPVTWPKVSKRRPSADPAALSGHCADRRWCPRSASTLVRAASARPKLILVKHARPQIEPEVPPSRWHLGDEGRESCGRLSAALRPFTPSFFTSPQPKAAETAALVAASFGTTAIPRDALREHDEAGAPFFHTEDEFAQAVREFFARPSECVFGAESASDALTRFATEVDGLLSEADRTVAVVSHGRVISLYVASCARLDAFEVWQRLTLPSFVVLDVTRRRVEHLAASV